MATNDAKWVMMVCFDKTFFMCCGFDMLRMAAKWNPL